MHMPRSQQRAHYHIRLSCAQLTLEAQNTGTRATEYTLWPNVDQIKEMISANVSLVFDFTGKRLFSLRVCFHQDEEGGRCCLIIFRFIQKEKKKKEFSPLPDTFHVPLKVMLSTLMPELHSSVHFRAFLLFSITSLPHTIQAGLNYPRFKQKTR